MSRIEAIRRSAAKAFAHLDAKEPVDTEAPTLPSPPILFPDAVAETPKLRVVPPPAAVPECEVIIEQQADGRYVVSLLRDHGTTSAAVIYTRAQLEMLQRRIPAALEVG